MGASTRQIGVFEYCKYLRPQQRPAERCAYPVKLEYLVAPLTAGIVTVAQIIEENGGKIRWRHSCQ